MVLIKLGLREAILCGSPTAAQSTHMQRVYRVGLVAALALHLG